MKVSVIIPCYNGEEYIGQTLGSLFDQTRPADEIIVVDDGSTDRSAEIAQSFGESVSVLSKGGGGAAKARNCGADHATGNAIMFLDADDVLAPDVLEHLINQLKKNPDGVVACPWYRLEKIGDEWVKRPPSCKTLGKNQDYLSGWLTGWYHPPCSVLWSRKAYKNTGGWCGYVNDDGDLMMRALTDETELQITDKGSSYYRRMPEEKQSESLSGARFTRVGREAEINVIQKIAQRLEDKGRLNSYRKPVTKALKNYRDLCKDQYPDLSEHCSELINRYGEPHYMQIARSFGRIGQKAVHNTRRLLSLLKKRVLLKIRSQNHSVKNHDKENYEEIRFGLDTYQKIIKAGKKGEIKKPSNPEVSVILPFFYDSEAFNRSLQSVLNQDYENFEVIVVGSKLNEDVQTLKKQFQDPRIYTVVDEINQNINSLRNLGLKKVKGEFVAFLNPEDEWFSDKLSKQLELFKSASDSIGLVYSGVEIKSREKESSVIIPKKRGDVYRDLLQKNVIGNCSSVMIRRTVIAGAGFFDESFSTLSEHDYWLRISRIYEFDFVEEPLYRLNQHHGSERKPTSKKIMTVERRSFYEKHQREMKRKGVIH